MVKGVVFYCKFGYIMTHEQYWNVQFSQITKWFFRQMLLLFWTYLTTFQLFKVMKIIFLLSVLAFCLRVPSLQLSHCIFLTYLMPVANNKLVRLILWRVQGVFSQQERSGTHLWYIHGSCFFLCADQCNRWHTLVARWPGCVQYILCHFRLRLYPIQRKSRSGLWILGHERFSTVERDFRFYDKQF